MLPVITAVLAVSICINAEPIPAQEDFTQQIVDNVNKLSPQFVKELVNETGSSENILFSPLSIYGALALLHLGATGTTREQLSSFMGLPSDDHRLLKAHENFGALVRDLQNTSSAKISVANGIFLDDRLKLRSDYANKTKNYYNSETQKVQFASAPSNATATVNQWISDRTYNRIEKMFQSNVPTDTEILLASALYFAGKWEHPFNKSYTQTRPFHTGKETIKVPMMSKKKKVPYTYIKALELEAMALPYSDSELFMLFVRPLRNHAIESFVETVTSEFHRQVIDSLQDEDLLYTIPRFSFKWSKNLSKQLQKFGLDDIFHSIQIDNIIDQKEPLGVSEIDQATFIEVNERGSKAAAATTISIELRSGPQTFCLDRSFMFSIYHKKTGLILFTGVVRNPTAT